MAGNYDDYIDESLKKEDRRRQWFSFLNNLFFLGLAIMLLVPFGDLGIIPHPSLIAVVFYLLLCAVSAKIPLFGKKYIHQRRVKLLTGKKAVGISGLYFAVLVAAVFYFQLEIWPKQTDILLGLNIFLSFIYAFSWYKLCLYLCQIEDAASLKRPKREW